MMPLALAYAFATDTQFEVKVEFDGYLPILGGKVGKAAVDMVVSAKPAGEGTIECAITNIKGTAFGADLPLNESNVEQFFPKSTVQFSPSGEVLKNSAPAVKMPARLPGLDSQRLPEISCLPLVLPQTADQASNFKRSFSGREVVYSLEKPVAVDSKWQFNFALRSEWTGFEGSFGRELPTSTGAKFKTASLLVGKGTATFDPALGQFEKVLVESTDTTSLTPIGAGSSTSRELKTKLFIKLKKS